MSLVWNDEQIGEKENCAVEKTKENQGPIIDKLGIIQPSESNIDEERQWIQRRIKRGRFVFAPPQFKFLTDIVAKKDNSQSYLKAENVEGGFVEYDVSRKIGHSA